MSATKICTGPAHAEPTRLPLDEHHWHFRRHGPRAGQPFSRCKLCANWRKLIEKNGSHGWVDIVLVRRYVDELIARCGSAHAVSLAHGIAESTLRSIEHAETLHVQKRTVARVIAALAAQRRADRRNGSSDRFLEAMRRRARIDERLERAST